MFGLFRRRKNTPAAMVSVWQRAGQAINRKQRQWADYLNQKVNRWSKKQVFIGLVLFCLGFGGGAVYVLWQSLAGTASSIKVKFITVPRHVLPDDKGEPTEANLSEVELEQVRQFQQYLDSLQRTPAGRQRYDSIKLYRAGLLDSLAMIQQQYREQLKTK